MATLSDLRERESDMLLEYFISATQWIEGKFSHALPKFKKELYPIKVFVFKDRPLSRSYDGFEITPEYDVWWTGYTNDMATLFTIHGPVYGPKTQLRTLNFGSDDAFELMGFYYLRTWILYSHAWCPDELDAAKAKLKMMWSVHPLKCPENDALPLKEVFDRYIDKVHMHRMNLLQGEPHVKWGGLTDMLPMTPRAV